MTSAQTARTKRPELCRYQSTSRCPQGIECFNIHPWPQALSRGNAIACGLKGPLRPSPITVEALGDHLKVSFPQSRCLVEGHHPCLDFLFSRCSEDCQLWHPGSRARGNYFLPRLDFIEPDLCPAGQACPNVERCLRLHPEVASRGNAISLAMKAGKPRRPFIDPMPLDPVTGTAARYDWAKTAERLRGEPSEATTRIVARRRPTEPSVTTRAIELESPPEPSEGSTRIVQRPRNRVKPVVEPPREEPKPFVDSAPTLETPAALFESAYEQAAYEQALADTAEQDDAESLFDFAFISRCDDDQASDTTATPETSPPQASPPKRERRIPEHLTPPRSPEPEPELELDYEIEEEETSFAPASDVSLEPLAYSGASRALSSQTVLRAIAWYIALQQTDSDDFGALQERCRTMLRLAQLNSDVSVSAIAIMLERLAISHHGSLQSLAELPRPGVREMMLRLPTDSIELVSRVLKLTPGLTDLELELGQEAGLKLTPLTGSHSLVQALSSLAQLQRLALYLSSFSIPLCTLNTLFGKSLVEVQLLSVTMPFTLPFRPTAKSWKSIRSLRIDCPRLTGFELGQVVKNMPQLRDLELVSMGIPLSIVPTSLYNALVDWPSFQYGSLRLIRVEGASIRSGQLTQAVDEHSPQWRLSVHPAGIQRLVDMLKRRFGIKLTIASV